MGGLEGEGGTEAFSCQLGPCLLASKVMGTCRGVHPQLWGRGGRCGGDSSWTLHSSARSLAP